MENDSGFWMFWYDENNDNIRFAKDYGTATWGQDVQSRASFPTSYLNIWKHIIVTWDGTSLSSGIHFYIDGTEVSKNNEQNGTGSALSDGALDLYIGNKHGDILNGRVDDVHIYNRILSASEIRQLYNMGTPAKLGDVVAEKNPLMNGLVGWWTMDGPDVNWTSATAGKVRDRSGKGNTGTLTNMSRTTSPTTGKIGQGMNFNGSSAYIDSSNFADNLPNFTVSAWAL